MHLLLVMDVPWKGAHKSEAQKEEDRCLHSQNRVLSLTPQLSARLSFTSLSVRRFTLNLNFY